MYFSIAVFLIVGLILSFIIYQNLVNKLSLAKIGARAWVTIRYYEMGLRETIKDNMYRASNQTELIPQVGDVAVITGGSRGIGFEVVKKLLQCDVCVIIGCRNVEAGESALQKIKASGIKIGNSKCYQLDVASLASIKKFADIVLENHSQINILVNNAGVMITPFALTEDGFESQFATNYLGHCYLSHLLLPCLTASARAKGLNSRIVNITSCIHSMGSINFEDLTMKDGYLNFIAYGQSKLAQVFFTKGLEARLRDSGIPVQVHAVHPGVVNTEIFQGSLVAAVVPWIMYLTFKSPEEGARSILHACISPRLATRGGTYITNCTPTETGGISNQKHIEKRLWNTMLDLLKLQAFGGIAKE